MSILTESALQSQRRNVEKHPGESLDEYIARRQQARRIVYQSWKAVPARFKTTGQWAEQNRRPRKDAQSNIFILLNPLYKNPSAKLYHIDQTQVYEPTPLE